MRWVPTPVKACTMLHGSQCWVIHVLILGGALCVSIMPLSKGGQSVGLAMPAWRGPPTRKHGCHEHNVARLFLFHEQVTNFQKQTTHVLASITTRLHYCNTLITLSTRLYLAVPLLPLLACARLIPHAYCCPSRIRLMPYMLI